MATVIGDLGNASGLIYIVDTDGTSVLSSINNTSDNVRRVIEDGASSNPIAAAGAYSSVFGRRYFLNSDAGADYGDLTGSIEITGYIVAKGLQGVFPNDSYTISSGVISPSRKASIILTSVDTQGGAGTDDLDTITGTGYSTGDIIFLRGVSGARVVTVKSGTGNINLASAVDFNTGDLTKAITLQWTGSAWNELTRTPAPLVSVSTMRSNGIAIPVQGVNKTTLTNGGGTISIEPGVDKGYQVYDGSPTLSGSWTIQINPTPSTPYLDGDEVIVDYRATSVVGGNTITIFGIALTATQALQGRVWLRAKYKLSNTTWYYSIVYGAQGVDITNKAYVDATFEPALGNPAGDGYILSSDTSGNRSWIPNAAGGQVAIDNVVFVAKNGDDGTGLAGRLDKPFLTFAAARTAAVALSPSATNRILIKAFSGTYDESIVLANYVDIDLSDAIIQLTSGTATYTITDANVSCNSVVYGQSVLSRQGAGTGGVIRTQNSGTILTVYCNAIIGSRGTIVVCNNGVQRINADVITDSSGNGVFIDNGSQYVVAKTITSTSGYCVQCSGGTQYIQASKIDAQNAAFEACDCQGGTQYVHSDIITSVDLAVYNDGGTQYIYSNVNSASTGTEAVSCNSGTQYLYGNIVDSFVGALAVNSAIQYIYGNISSSDTCISCDGSAIQKFYGTAISTGAVPGICISGTQYVHGRLETSAVNTDAYTQAAPGVSILDGVTLIANGTGKSLTAGSAVLVYNGAVSNKSVGAGATVTVGTLTVSGSVV